MFRKLLFAYLRLQLVIASVALVGFAVVLMVALSYVYWPADKFYSVYCFAIAGWGVYVIYTIITHELGEWRKHKALAKS